MPAGRDVVELPSRVEEGAYAFREDESGIVLESHEGLDRPRPWMRLVEYVIEPA